MPFSQEQDRTDFFLNMEGELDPVSAGVNQTSSMQIEEGEHGVIPVAALVKVFQGFQEPAHPHPVAILFAGLVSKKGMISVEFD